jgi:hypothetical protein
MALLQDHFARHTLLTLTAGGLILGTVAHVQAADEGGFGGLLHPTQHRSVSRPLHPPCSLPSVLADMTATAGMRGGHRFAVTGQRRCTRRPDLRCATQPFPRLRRCAP